MAARDAGPQVDFEEDENIKPNVTFVRLSNDEALELCNYRRPCPPMEPPPFREEEIRRPFPPASVTNNSSTNTMIPVELQSRLAVPIMCLGSSKNTNEEVSSRSIPVQTREYDRLRLVKNQEDETKPSLRRYPKSAMAAVGKSPSPPSERPVTTPFRRTFFRAFSTNQLGTLRKDNSLADLFPDM
jgi:hypothetical protein